MSYFTRPFCSFYNNKQSIGRFLGDIYYNIIGTKMQVYI